MADLPERFPSPPSAIEHVARIIDDFIDHLQMIWAANAENGVVLTPGSRLAREIELALIRIIGATVAPEAVFSRIGTELNRFVHQVDRIANPLFHDILICCYRLMEGWDDQGMWNDIQSIEDSVRDAETYEERGLFRFGLPAQIDLELYHRMERTMIADHQLRMRIEAYVERLEDTIANLPAEDNDDDIVYGSEDDNDDDDDDVEMGDEDTVNPV
ncbi:hypothetical protein NHQ30_004097 [Ciborinia camelliae]|nr:hypothetical protein NHQ30_004097 [Ciborinia camelliae]